MQIIAENDLHASVGDTVRVELGSKKIVGASFLAYLVPLLFFLLGLLIGNLISEIFAVVIGLVLCTASFFVLRCLDHSFQKKQTFQPHITAIIDTKDTGEE